MVKKTGKKKSKEKQKDAQAAAEQASEGKAEEAKTEEQQKADVQEDLTNKLLRLQADFDNYRKRVARERTETYTRANEDLMMEILPVIDHMDMAIKSAADHDAPPALLDGVRLVADQLRGALGKFGLEKVDALGKEFDPNEHEAISHLPSEDFEENMVMDQTRLGYKLKGRVLRAAQVVVSSGKPETKD